MLVPQARRQPATRRVGLRDPGRPHEARTDLRDGAVLDEHVDRVVGDPVVRGEGDEPGTADQVARHGGTLTAPRPGGCDRPRP